MILGLSLSQRAVLAARRAGYAKVFLLGGNGRSANGTAAVADWRELAATLSSSAAPLIIAPAAILAWWFQRQRRREQAKKADRDAVLRAWQRRNRERGITANAAALVTETQAFLDDLIDKERRRRDR